MYQILVDSALAKRAQAVFQRQGRDITEAVNAFLLASVEPDPFTDEELAAAFDRGQAQIRAGKSVSFTLEELEAMVHHG